MHTAIGVIVGCVVCSHREFRSIPTKMWVNGEKTFLSVDGYIYDVSLRETPSRTEGMNECSYMLHKYSEKCPECGSGYWERPILNPKMGGTMEIECRDCLYRVTEINTISISWWTENFAVVNGKTYMTSRKDLSRVIKIKHRES